MRDIISTSQVYSALLSVGYRTNIGNVKAILKELGFPWNGKSCSVYQLLSKVKEYVNPELIQREKSVGAGPADQPLLFGYKKREGTQSIMEVLKDLFYGSGMSLYQVFRQATNSDVMTFEQFQELVNHLSQL